MSNERRNISDDCFKFSVVMAVYNTEKYLKDSIDSIINQSIGFEENIQLILVNDGSEDSSLEILFDYQENFPNNVLVLNQENSGQANARNNGLKHVKAKYVNFLDSDDYIAENAFEEVYYFFESHKNETDIVSIPMMFFGKKCDEHMLNDKFVKSRIIDLSKEHNSPQLSASSAFFKREVFNKYEFPTNVLFSEDAILINKILLDNPFLGVLNTTKYFYRRRFDEDSTMDIVHTKKEYFVDKLKDYYLYLFEYAESKTGEVPYFLQYTLAYDLQWIFHEDLSILNEKEITEFYFYLNKVLDYIEGDIILYNTYIKNPLTQQFFYSLKKDDFHFEISDEDVSVKIGDYLCSRLSNHKIWLDIVDLRDDILSVSGFLNTHIDFNYLSFEAIKYFDDSESNYFAKLVKYTSRANVKFLSKTFQFKNNFDWVIPINKNENSIVKFKINYHKDGDNSNFNPENVVSIFPNIGFTDHAKLSKLSYYKVNNSNFLFVRDNSFYIVPYSFRLLVKKELGNLLRIKMDMDYIPSLRIESYREIIKLRILYLITFPFFRLIKRFKMIYLFEDRIDIADDNAFHLFKYANSVNDNVRKYFVLSEDSKQRDIVSKIGKVLIHGSFKHKFLMLHTDKVISTHPYETVINPFWSFEKNQRHLVAGLLNYKIYFLQHGVTKDNISSWMSKYDKNLSLIVTVSDLESESFLEEGYGYDESIIQNLGFPRFDNLEKHDIKQILIIPTWRKNLRVSKEVFLGSEYFNNLNSVLNNLKLVNDDYKVVFKPHPELVKNIEETSERFIDLFDIPDNVHLAIDESYQELLNSSSVLITDYSSVFFDFAYLKKPVIYYHPNDDYHYEKSYFDYNTMGFGDIAKSSEELFDKLDYYIKNDFKMEDEYKKRVDEFFTYSDKNNSKRVYDWILKN